MNILIIGAGSIGIHLSYILYGKGINVFVLCRKNKYEVIKDKLVLEIKNNDKKLKRINLIKETDINFINNISKLKKIKFNYIFLTIKILKNYTKLYEKIEKVIGNQTSIIPPCTVLPSWWLNKYGNKNRKKEFEVKNFNKLLCMTMWLSGEMNKNKVIMRHSQRGYPVGSISKKNTKSAKYLNKLINNKIKSKYINNPYGELYLKVINSFAFNLVAILYNQNNYQLSKNKEAIRNIENIMKEFDKQVLKIGIELNQSIKSRISQTLNSKKHTMSMLKDFRLGKKIELSSQWKSLNNIKELKPKVNLIKTNLLYKRVSEVIMNANL